MGVRRRITPRQRHVEIGRRVVFDAQSKLLRRRGHRGMRALFTGTVRIACYPRFVQSVAPQLVEQCTRQFTLRRYRVPDVHAPPHLRCREIKSR